MMVDKFKPNMRSVTVVNLAASALAASVVGFLSYYFGDSTVGMFSLLATFVIFFVPAHFSYRSQEYKVSEDEIEFYEGFINIEKRNIAFDKITDITMEQSIEQRFLNTGDIKINTAGSSDHEVKLEHLDSPEEVYEYLREKAGVS